MSEASISLAAKLDPETLAIRTKPARAIRFRRGVIIAVAALGSVSLVVVAWIALKPRVFSAVADARELSEPSNRPSTDALNGLPSTYGDTPKLGPPLPGDLGRPILESQRRMATEAGAGNNPSGQSEAQERERRLSELRAARQSGVLVQGRTATSPLSADAAATPAVPTPEASGPTLDPDRDPNAQGRKAQFVGTLDRSGDINPHTLTAAPSPYLLSAGSVISASLITGLRSDLPGLVTAQVTSQVFDSPTGRILLIPQGSRLIGSYDSVVAFSEDVDLTIRATAPRVDKIASPMEVGIGTKERERRTKALKAAAQDYVATVAMPSLTRAIETALGTTNGWSIEPDPDDKDRQTLLFNFPRTSANEDGGGYIKPRIKLEYGARGDPEPFETRSIVPYLAEEFSDELPDAETPVKTLNVTRTFWEKATILHALHHNGKLREGMSRHYYDMLMLDRAGVTVNAVAQPDLLASVIRNKSLMFADNSASYGTASLGQLRLLPNEETIDRLRNDYTAMADMFMVTPPAFKELLAGLADLETKINDNGAREPSPTAV